MHFLGSSVKMARLGPLRFWAERGLVRVEDGRDNSYEVLSVKEALLRVKGLNDMLGNKTTSDEKIVDSAYRKDLTRFVEDMVTICQQAREQGMPTDPSAVSDMKRRQKKQVVVPTNVVDMDNF